MKIGKWRTHDKDIEEDKGTNPFPEIDDTEPLAIFTWSLPEQVEYDVNNVCKPVIWLVAPEPMIQGLDLTIPDWFCIMPELAEWTGADETEFDEDSSWFIIFLIPFYFTQWQALNNQFRRTKNILRWLENFAYDLFDLFLHPRPRLGRGRG